VPLIGPAGDETARCDSCLQTPHRWNRGRAVALYGGGARKLILALKHGDQQQIARPAGQWLAQAAAPLVAPNTVIAPVPLHRWRLMRRRYNQSALLARETAKLLSREFCPDLLIRTRSTKMLDGMGNDERYQQLSGAIKVNRKRKSSVKGRSVLIVDDVMTSGATLDACATACLRADAKTVDVLVLARVANQT